MIDDMKDEVSVVDCLVLVAIQLDVQLLGVFFFCFCLHGL